MLQVEEVTVTFGGVRAVDEASLQAPAGEITGLIGPNGAGKTTLFNVITGLQKPVRGQVLLDGFDVTTLGPKSRAQRGLGRTFQRLEIFGSLTALDNVLVAVENSGVHGRAAVKAAMDLLDRVGIAEVAGSQADVLPTGTARLVELARALACSPKLLLLDEPFSGLDTNESARLGDLLEQLAAEGLAVLLVEHDMEMVMRLCRTIYVLNFGRAIASGPPAEIREHPDVQAAYLGAPIAAAGAGA